MEAKRIRKLAENDLLIERLANIMHEDIFQDNTDYKNLSIYLNKYGINVLYADVNYNGTLEFAILPTKPAITINIAKHQLRQRITMAFFLGVLILDFKWNPYKNFFVDNIMDIFKYQSMFGICKNGRKRKKYFNRFALAFLMPKTKIDELLGHVILRREAEIILSKVFCVTVPVARLRLNDLRFWGMQDR